ncbi:MAG: hypothetical protein AMXMBFR64_59590 [Myxococcales bacterium]
MNRTCTLVCYDVSDPKRLRKVFQICRRFGDHLQYSVFRAELSPRSRAELIKALDEAIDHRQDQVLLVDIGPAGPSAASSFAAVGRPYTHPERHAVIL